MDKGIYSLVIYLASDKVIRIGKLGRFQFKRGYYVYSGSAMGGLKARIARHKRREKTIHWHIDYLLKEAKIVEVFVHTEGQWTECRLNEMIFGIKGAEPAVSGFGSSDCRCEGHLAYFREGPGLEDLNGLSFFP